MFQKKYNRQVSFFKQTTAQPQKVNKQLKLKFTMLEFSTEYEFAYYSITAAAVMILCYNTVKGKPKEPSVHL